MDKIKNRPRKTSKEQLLETLKLKRECNKRAQQIIEAFLEPAVEQTTFVSKLKFINRSQYEDVVEERSICKLCGYPLCDQSLSSIPDKKYHISTATNKVFDIRDRKKFCSNGCYKASEYIKEQLLTSPLWLRNQDVLSEFELLKLEH